MAVAVTNHREEPETLVLTVVWRDDDEVRFEEKSLPLPGKAPKPFFLDEVVDDLPEGVLSLYIKAESRRPLGGIGLRYTDGTFSTVPFWPIDLSPYHPGQCGDGPNGRVD